MDEITTFTKELRLPGMENCWRSLIETRRVDGMSLRDGLQRAAAPAVCRE